MKTILRKTLGVISLISLGPILSVLTNYYYSSTPDPVQAIKNGLVADVMVLIAFLIGWYIGKFAAWCFKND